MRKLSATLLWLLCGMTSGAVAWGQTTAGIARSVRWGGTLPSICTPGGISNVFFLTAAGPTGWLYTCTAVNTWTASGGGASAATILSSTVTLTAANIEALNTTPFSLVPAQGSGKVIFPVAAFAQYKFGTTPFTDATGNNALLTAAYAGDTSSFTTYFIYPLFYFDGAGGAGRTLTGSASKLSVAGSAQASGQIGFAGNGTQPLQSWADNQALVLTFMDNQGGLRTAAIRTAGTGYATNDIADVTGCTNGGSGGQVKITAQTAGVPTAISVQTVGSAYTAFQATNCGTTASVGIGTGLTVDVTVKSWHGGDGTLTVTTLYQSVTLH